MPIELTKSVLTGMIKRASVPTNDQLGFDPDYASVDAEKIAAGYTSKLEELFKQNNVEGLVEAMCEDGWWRDVYLVRVSSSCSVESCS